MDQSSDIHSTNHGSSGDIYVTCIDRCTRSTHWVRCATHSTANIYPYTPFFYNIVYLIWIRYCKYRLVDMCAYIYIYIYTCRCVCIYIYICIHMYKHLSIDINIIIIISISITSVSYFSGGARERGGDLPEHGSPPCLGPGVRMPMHSLLR